jgi:imidazolonepropionase-like amidohydrolase
MLGLSDEIGTLELGKVADLVVFDGNPFVDPTTLRQVRWTVQGGIARTPEEWMSLDSEHVSSDDAP